MVGPDGEFIDTCNGRVINPGHCIETAWFIMEEAKYRNWDKDLLQLALQILDWSWEWGWDKEFGGIINFKDCKNLPPQDYSQDMKFWWPQTEAVIATLYAYLATGNEKYLDMHKQISDWTYAHFPDKECGEWFGYLHRDGTPAQMAKGNLFKGPFHIPRMMIKGYTLCKEILDNKKSHLSISMKNSKIYPWVVVGLLWGVALLNYMDRQMLSTMRDAMAVDITELQSAANFGRLMGVFLWIYGCMSPIAGMVGDRMNRKWLIVGSLFVWSAVTYLMGIADTYNEVFFLRALMGISEALYIPAGLSLIADYHSDKSRSLAIGIHMTGLYTGQAIGGFGATVAAAFSWHTTFHWFGIAGIAYAVILMLFLHEKKDRIQIEQINSPSGKEKSNLLKGLSLLFSNIAFWVILLYFAAPSLPGWATKNWLPTLFAENLNIPMSQAGPMSTITIALSSFIGVIIGGTLSDKWVQRNIKGRVYTGAIGLGLTIPSLLLLGFGHSFVAVVGAGLLFGIGYGIFDANNMPILCQFVSSKHRATAYGIMNMTGVFAGAAITEVLGKWTDGGKLGLGFAMLAIIVLIALVVQLTFLRPKTDNME